MSTGATAPDSLLLSEDLKQKLGQWLTTHDAEDVLQIVAEKLWRLPREHSGPYLSRTLRNAAVDRQRSSRTRRKYEAAFGAQLSVVDERSPERVVEAIQAIEALQCAVAELKPLNQEIFLRCCVEGHPQTAVAASLGLHVSTVEKRLAKARRHCFDRIRHHLDLK